MPTIDFKNTLRGVDPTIVGLPTSLARIGVDVPDDITSALGAARWTVSPPDLSGLMRAVAEAKTQDEFNARAFELAQARVIGDFIETDSVFRQFHQSLAAQRLLDAVHRHGEDLIARVIEVYDPHARVFSEALAAVPDLTGTGLFDLSPDQAAAMQTAKTEALEMTAALAAYDGLARGLGHKVNPGNGPRVEAAFSRATQIGEFPDAQSMAGAADLINAYASQDGTTTLYAPLAPHAAVVLKGGTLRLAHPAHARAHLDSLLAE